MNTIEKLAMLLTADGADVQDQGWELLCCLPEVPLPQVQGTMQGMLMAQLQLRAWTGLLGEEECTEFTRRFFALRRFCDVYDVPWRGARLQVDRWRLPSPPHKRCRIRLWGGQYDIGRGQSEDEPAGAYAMVHIPRSHPLRDHADVASHLGGLFHDRFVLSWAGTHLLAHEHPARLLRGRCGHIDVV